MQKHARVGIYGGTFDPPHIGHLHAASAFLSLCALDRLYIVPTGIPPHKSEGTNASLRMDMVRLAFGEHDYADARIEISDFEQSREGKSYSYHTLCHFKERADKLYLLCGEDMFLTLESWYRAEDIFKLATVVCFSRGSDAGEQKHLADMAALYESAYGAHVLLPQFSPLPISSTAVRKRLQDGLSTDGFLTPSVQTYIKEHNLYKL